MGMLSTFFMLPRELCDQETHGYVFCTPLLVTDRLMLIKTKLHCSEISKKLFPDYCGRRTTERTCSNMYIHSEFSIEIDLVMEKFRSKRN
ncbi:hypothetical protein T09_5498 [Trichinella sp. T9]|nr:hypothetical protein T09_5498 [Trichinella sp. T9]